MCAILINGEKVFDNLIWVKSPIGRILGLIPYKTIPSDTAMVLKGANSIHTCFMKFSIDVLYVDKNNVVLAAFNDVKPYGFLPWIFKSAYVIECAAGCLSAQKGDIISFDGK